MNLLSGLKEREGQGTPIRVGLIGAGKFGTMFLAQAQNMPGVRVVAIADLNLDRARTALEHVGWSTERPHLTEDSDRLIAGPAEIVIDATGSPSAGIRHALSAAANGKHIVMVNVEADALAGPLLARRAAEAGTIYSMAYGDQPALIIELVDWARTAGFEVVCAGKGTKYLPIYHASTPNTVWSHYGFSQEQLASGDFNARMFNSFLDGTKSAIEMAALANGTGLKPRPEGLAFPPVGCDGLASVLGPGSQGTVEVVSSLRRDGSPVPHDLRWGVYVVFKASTDYARRCFAEYGLVTDSSGWYAALYRPYHLIGLELGISIASIALRGEPTGCPIGFQGDAVAVAKRDLRPGETLDGEGGFTVWGKLVPAERSLAAGALPIGLANDVSLRRAVASGDVVTCSDVSIDETSQTVRVRREMETIFSPVRFPEGHRLAR
ncbi:MAG TPA: Gfo/Idh/MocA family oxidoreductase [Alphaproteobacteria bacterium]|nr:Gfo/Idh/MocA family oxidoreductase [Alphaproteobacteria bacterium]